MDDNLNDNKMATQATGSGKHVKPLAQECWRVMRRGTNMKKVWIGTRNKIKESRQARTKRVYLTKEQNQIVYVLEGVEKIINISDVTKVSTAETDPEKFQVAQTKFSTDTCFAVVTNRDEIYFAASCSDEASLWVNGINYLIENVATKFKGEKRRKEWLEAEFKKLQKPGNNFVKYVDLLSFLTSQGININPSILKKSLKKFLRSKEKTLDRIPREEFVEFLQDFLLRSELLNLFYQCSSDGCFMSIDDLQYFQTNRQCQASVSRDQCQRLVDTFELTREGRANSQLGIDGFIKFLSSEEGELFDPEHDRVYQDMSQPFAHYFIASSHNTYLVSDQLKGDSSVEAYVNVLKEGCRCVELDCWDGDNDEPVVYHGRTLTSKILFKDILQAVKKNAFKVSPYPVILNIENHCSVEFQNKMARHLSNILGDLLYRKPVDESLASSHSPEMFKNKIFVRGKKLKPETEKSNGDFASIDDDDDESEDDDDENAGENSRPAPVTQGNGVEKQADAPGSTHAKKTTKKPSKPIAKEFSDLINYFTNTHFQSFAHSAEHGKFYESSSFSEKKMFKFVERNPAEFVEYNKRQISRIYPGALRMDSSNFNPQDAWNAGCQIVALNQQTRSGPVQLHLGKFRQNGRAGYVLKPSFLTSPGTISDEGGVARVLKVTIISGYRLSPSEGSQSSAREDLDPYVKVNIHGVPADKFSFRTKTVQNNTYNPKWTQSFEARITVPELALVRFCVYDEDVGNDDFIAQSTLPFTSMRQGYRHVILLNKKGEAHHSGSLFVHVTISEDAIGCATSAGSVDAEPGSAYRQTKEKGCTMM